MDLHTEEEETPNLENKLMVARREGSGQEIGSLGWTCAHCYI